MIHELQVKVRLTADVTIAIRSKDRRELQDYQENLAAGEDRLHPRLTDWELLKVRAVTSTVPPA